MYRPYLNTKIVGRLVSYTGKSHSHLSRAKQKGYIVEEMGGKLQILTNFINLVRFQYARYFHFFCLSCTFYFSCFDTPSSRFSFIMVNELHIPQYPDTPSFDKVQDTPNDVGSSQEKTSVVRYDEIMPTPELLGDDTSSLQALDSPHSFIALDVTDELEHQVKRQRIDSLLSPISNSAEDEVSYVDELPAANSSSSSSAGIHHVWTTEEEKV